MLSIRAEQVGDIEGIYGVNAESFPTPAEARLVDQLRIAGRLSISLVAELDGVIVGHVGFSEVTLPSGEVGIGLAPVAVAKAYRMQGIAAALIRNGLEICQAKGFGWCVVLGEPDYYSRFGFQPASEVGLSDEYGGGDAFQYLELFPGELPKKSGLVSFAPEFGLVS